MIGGIDIMVQVDGDLRGGEALDTVVRCVRNTWPKAIIQNARTGEVFRSFSEIAFGLLREIFVYRDRAAFASWAARGAENPPESRNAMLHFLTDRESRLTIVVDDPTHSVVMSIVAEIRGALDPLNLAEALKEQDVDGDRG